LLAAGGCKDKKDGGAPAATPSEKGKPEAAKPADKPKLAELDASAAAEAYKGWKLMAPEGATAKEAFGALEVKAGDGFQLEVHSGALDMPGRKKEIGANDVNKLKRYVTDTPEAIVYESEVMGKTEFHFLAGQKVGDEAVSCEDTKGPTYTQAQVETMLEACKSLHK
jgi:hypothetical protein